KMPEAVRPLLQEWGMFRRAQAEDYWLDAWDREAWARHIGSYVIPDTRFENECRRILERGGKLVRVGRPGFLGDDHETEHALDHWSAYDLIVDNSSTIEALEAQVSAWMQTV